MRRAARRWLALALLWPACAVSLQVQARELLVVGAQFERVFEYQDSGEYAGLGVELVRLMATRTGYTVRFRMLPWARAQAMLVQGQADILIGPYKTPERIASMGFSDKPFYQDQMVFYTRQDASFDWDGDPAVLKNRRVVLLNGWAYGTDWERMRHGLQISVANNVENGLKMLVHKHVDVFVSNRRNTDPVISRLGYGRQVKPLPKVIEIQNGYFAFPRSPAFDKLRLQFDQELNKLIETGELKRLGKRYDVGVP
ncbi:MAG: amino acid ABC transporter substrate-binding protein [Janthinobacterium lividum]|uniref:ABC transporter substrate-binding protein n=1 Tax=Janthinobacterium lividum TaxID=29581 RepID=A0A1E8PL06_9BURK|nr:amino acid ABC transporter substrate-binding protein [Janthinobacterium lividum]OFJ46537.1 ABC transporter substrate-binding protein [Janthinobacterium lividum]